jgi:dTDP-4-amino-4,6-dideoxygalactose transaminase
LQSIQERYNENTVAVVFIHSFGNTQDLISLRKWCDEKNIILIEDIAQALGALLPCGNPVGFYGDFSIYSFNPTKLIETGGGALLIKNNTFTKDCHVAFKYFLSLYLDVSAKEKQTLALSYKNLHQGLTALDRIYAATQIDSFFLSLQKAYEPLYVLNFTQHENFVHEWNNIDIYNLDRIEKAEIYSSILNNNKSIEIISNYQQSKVCWRYSILIDNEDNLIDISDKIRLNGFHVSNLYWPVNFFFNSNDICVNAYTFARRIINFWVDKSIDKKYVEACSKSLIKHMNNIK